MIEDLGNEDQKDQKNAHENTKRESETVSDDVDSNETEFQKPVKKNSKHSWWAKIMLTIFWFCFSLVALVFIAINLPITKQFIADQALQFLNKDFKTNISSESVEVNFLF